MLHNFQPAVTQFGTPSSLLALLPSGESNDPSENQTKANMDNINAKENFYKFSILLHVSYSSAWEI